MKQGKSARLIAQYLVAAGLLLFLGLHSHSSEVDKKNQKILYKSLLHADSVLRETVWLLNGRRPPEEGTPFGRLAVALVVQQKKIKKGSGSFCDRFRIERQTMVKQQSFSVYEVCRKGENLLARIDERDGGLYVIAFDPKNLGDFIGTSASLFGKPFSCELKPSESGGLEKLGCSSWYQEREGAQYVRLDRLNYEVGSNHVLEFEGKVIEGVKAVRDISGIVPLTGKIQIKEKLLVDPAAFEQENDQITFGEQRRQDGKKQESSGEKTENSAEEGR
ncbi:MAG: hypothetical protein N2578_01730 [Bdellovibrionaceae bacterium]|nr:hypothetical protein [Pseudobdellovibrionaceae bacterium]